MPVFNKCYKRKKKGQENDSDESADDDAQAQKASKAPPKKSYDTDADKIMNPTLVEATMPTYFSIGGTAKECLINGYKIGAWHFDCTSKMNEMLSFYSFGTGKPTFRDITGGVGITEKFGIFSSSQVWQTDGILATLGVQTRIGDGMFKGMLRGTYTPQYSDTCRLEINTGYEHSPIKLDVIIPILHEPKLMGYVVVEPAKNYLLGCRAVYDVTNMGFDKHALGVGYNNGSTEVGLKLENFRDVRGSLFQRIGERWAVALKGNLYSEEEKHFAIGGQYQLSENGLLKAKLRNDGFLGLVYKINVGEHIGIMYHVGLDTAAPLSGDHKLGLSWSLKC